MLSAIFFYLDQSKILSSGNELIKKSVEKGEYASTIIFFFFGKILSTIDALNLDKFSLG